MRVSFALPFALPFAVVVAWPSLAACTLPAGEPCCSDDLACNDGARCFERRCALLCDDDSQCDEGETCLDAGVCAVGARSADDSCPAAAAEEES